MSFIMAMVLMLGQCGCGWLRMMDETKNAASACSKPYNKEIEAPRQSALSPEVSLNH